MEKKEKKKIVFLIILLVILDQAIKLIMQLVNKVNENTESQDNFQYILISIIALMALIRYIKSKNLYIKMDSRVVLSFATSGVIGNLIDRIFRGHVVNYINIPRFAWLNLGYIYIIIAWVGMAAILTGYTRNRLRETKIQNEIKNRSRKK